MMNVSNSKKYAAFTVCNLAYLPKALVLAESLLKHEQKKLKIYLTEKRCDVALPDSLAEFIWIEDAEVPNLYDLAFKYDITEFSTSVKPFLALKLLEKFDNVIFLDPDTCVYQSLDPILADLEAHPIVLTPHYTKPHDNAWPGSDVGMMRFGSFNLGFFAINKSSEGIDFLKWWSDRCFRFCYFETQFGLSTDQKWVSIAPCFFEHLYVSFNLGYNVAFWNMQERDVSKDGNGNYVVNEKYPLIFFHFSSFDEKKPDLLSKRPFPQRGENKGALLELSLAYKAALLKHTTAASKQKYGFDYMSNGDYISPTLRRAYACVSAELEQGCDPFSSDGPVGKFAKKNFLLEKKPVPYVSSSFNDIGQHKDKFAIVNFCMRLILRTLGPNRFANFSRLLVYLSSYRQNRDMWKI
ncbi:hypothetical protein BCF11_3121 [Collimonas sp. PA-H2]|uniref:hypothetical protein n=1 Tax=Collimonas sp. PA-H2 TaxID=1881062 RepID=UPI000BF9D999|nr:hypothetical protein [Collimonas sp. PA-H2]PFH10694.1 hypothetical protein BCF11_3121 [Collimonas sp. PA-H2]